MQIPSNKIRFALPSKGRMGKSTIEFLEKCGLRIHRKNRDYIGSIAMFPDVQIVFQNQSDIIRGIEGGSLNFGIVGLDLVSELVNSYSSETVIIHDNLEFGRCNLEMAIPEEWKAQSLEEIFAQNQKLRIATKFPRCTERFLADYRTQFEIVEGKGALEVYPALNYCDIIVDLVSSGETLQANRLKQIQSGCILSSQAVFIGNRFSLEQPEVLEIARQLLEYFEAYLRGKKYVQIFANMKEADPQELTRKLFALPELSGLQGPTISPVYTPSGQTWNAIHIIVPKIQLQKVIRALRSIGGSGVIVSPTLYIFEEEPLCYQQLLQAIRTEVGS